MRDELSAEEMRAWAPRAEPSAPSADLRLPGYSGFQLVAQGGEGAVYRARQDGLGRDVAIKALQAIDPATQARFRRELEITVRLGRQHPHIVTVLDTGTLPDGRPCIVMEFYDLGSLHDRLRALGPLPVAEVVAAGTAVADALAFAHAQGFLHRDVKPQNVLVLPTSYVLADFGIARGADAGHSASLQMVSYRHAAPQMVAGEPPAAADDLWSLGSTLFTLLSGHPPFAGDNPDEDTVLSYLDRVRSAEPRPLTRADIPQPLAEIIARCLSKRRADRYPDAAALRDALASVGADLRRWQPTVDPDATSLAPGAAPPAEDITGLAADFGPTPPPEPDPSPAPEPAKPRPAPESRGTMTGRLADLTQRHTAPPPADFGPGSAPPAPVPPTPAPPWPNHAEPPAAPHPTPPPHDKPPAALPPSALPPSAPLPTPHAEPPAAVGPPAPSQSPLHAEPPAEATPLPATARAEPPTAITSPASVSTPSPAEPPTAVASDRPLRAIGEHPASQDTHAGPSRTQACQPPAPFSPPPRQVPGPNRASPVPGTWPPARGDGPAPPPRDTPTVPKLTPSALDGFPAMPEAYEWEYDTAPDALTAEATEPSTRWRGFAIAGIVAAVVGVGIGMLASRDVTTSAPTPSTTTAPPTSAPIPPGGDPAVAPVLTKVEDRGDEAELTWEDPTGGQAQFVLYDVTVTRAGAVPQPVTGIAAGLTSFVVTGLDPAAPEYCFQLVAIGLVDPSTQRGASDRVCVSR